MIKISTGGRKTWFSFTLKENSKKFVQLLIGICLFSFKNAFCFLDLSPLVLSELLYLNWKCLGVGLGHWLVETLLFDQIESNYWDKILLIRSCLIRNLFINHCSSFIPNTSIKLTLNLKCAMYSDISAIWLFKIAEFKQI